MRGRFLLFLEKIRSSYWFIPSLMLTGSAALAVFLVALDQRLDTEKLQGLWWIFSGGAEGARSVLSTVAGSVISVAGTTFSITIAVLSLTSSQFGPRLLQGFLRDTSNQFVLGTFVATFLYCLLVLRMVRSVEESYFVPHLAVTGGVLLAIASVCFLIYFIHHVSVSIQASRIIAGVSLELEQSIDRLFPDGVRKEPAPEVPPLSPEETARYSVISADRSGYIQAVDEKALLALASENKVLLRIQYAPGQFVTRDSTLAIYRPVVAVSEMAQKINAAFTLGERRTATQDIEYLVLELVEVAVRALSPGINDPFTAVICIDRLGAALSLLAGRNLPSAVRFDAEGTVRLITRPVSFAGLVEAAFGEIRHYGKDDPVVKKRLKEVLEELSAYARTEEQKIILRKEAASLT